jgi:hypothetical protein
MPINQAAWRNIAVSEDDLGRALRVKFEDVRDAQHAGQVAQMHNLGRRRADWSRIESRAQEFSFPLVMASAQANQVIQPPRIRSKGLIGEVLPHPSLAPVIMSVPAIISDEFVSQLKVFGGWLGFANRRRHAPLVIIKPFLKLVDLPVC